MKNNEGVVEMYHPPIMVITSNDERDFSDAFKRRCVVVDLDRHDSATLQQILENHLGGGIDTSSEIAKKILDSGKPTDVILQAFYLAEQQESTEDKIGFIY